MPPPRDPFANLERMRREMDELFGGVLGRAGLAARRGFTPRVDVFYCGEPARAVVKVELAGIDPADVSLEIRGRQLLIAGERRAQETEGRVYQQIEIENGPFRRVVELGADVAGDEARASYEEGVLRIDVPLRERDPEPRRVPIRAGEGAPSAAEGAPAGEQRRPAHGEGAAGRRSGVA